MRVPETNYECVNGEWYVRRSEYHRALQDRPIENLVRRGIRLSYQPDEHSFAVTLTHDPQWNIFYVFDPDSTPPETEYESFEDAWQVFSALIEQYPKWGEGE